MSLGGGPGYGYVHGSRIFEHADVLVSFAEAGDERRVDSLLQQLGEID
jgi:hypothetical protein